jgi:hypothetical protein
MRNIELLTSLERKLLLIYLLNYADASVWGKMMKDLPLIHEKVAGTQSDNIDLAYQHGWEDALKSIGR